MKTIEEFIKESILDVDGTVDGKIITINDQLDVLQWLLTQMDVINVGVDKPNKNGMAIRARSAWLDDSRVTNDFFIEKGSKSLISLLNKSVKSYQKKNKKDYGIELVDYSKGASRYTNSQGRRAKKTYVYTDLYLNGDASRNIRIMISEGRLIITFPDQDQNELYNVIKQFVKSNYEYRI